MSVEAIGRGEVTRGVIVDAASELFAAHGIDGPSLREITRAAGQRNTAALQYHFGDRDALLTAVVGRHAATVARHREQLLDDGDGSLRSLVDALVLPYVGVLGEHHGAAWVQVLHEIWSQPQRFEALVQPDPALLRWTQLVATYLPSRALGRPLHRRYAATRFVLSETSNRAREKRSDHRLFASHLVDMTAALLSAPVSPDTARLIR